MYTKNCETLIKETEDTNKWKDTLHSWIGIINIVNMSILPKVIYRFKAIPCSILMAFFTDFETNNSEICMDSHIHTKRKNLNSQSNPEKE